MMILLCHGLHHSQQVLGSRNKRFDDFRRWKEVFVWDNRSEHVQIISLPTDKIWTQQYYVIHIKHSQRQYNKTYNHYLCKCAKSLNTINLLCWPGPPVWNPLHKHIITCLHTCVPHSSSSSHCQIQRIPKAPNQPVPKSLHHNTQSHTFYISILRCRGCVIHGVYRSKQPTNPYVYMLAEMYIWTLMHFLAM